MASMIVSSFSSPLPVSPFSASVSPLESSLRAPGRIVQRTCVH